MSDPIDDLFSELTEQDLRGLDGMHLPPKVPDFDLTTASNEQLKSYFLPPRPDRAREPDAFALWMEVMKGPLQWPDLNDRPRILVLKRLFGSTKIASQRKSGVQESSANWSGANVRPNDGSKLVSVYGTWGVPDPKPPPAFVRGSVFASSAWIGLDGHDAASRSLPQIGSGHVTDAAGSKKRTFLWWEWFVLGAVNGYKTIGVPVKVGDLIYAQITKISAQRASFCVVNLSAVPKFIFPFHFHRDESPAQPHISPTNPIFPEVEGHTAEWIVERPSYRTGPHAPFFDFNDFGVVSFSHSLAATDHPDPARAAVNLGRARMQRMIEWRHPPAGSRVLATPKRGDATHFSVNYRP